MRSWSKCPPPWIIYLSLMPWGLSPFVHLHYPFIHQWTTELLPGSSFYQLHYNATMKKQNTLSNTDPLFFIKSYIGLILLNHINLIFWWNIVVLSTTMVTTMVKKHNIFCILNVLVYNLPWNFCSNIWKMMFII